MILKLITLQSLLLESKCPGTLDTYGKELEIRNVLPNLAGQPSCTTQEAFTQGRFWPTAYLIPNNHKTGGSLWCSRMTWSQVWTIYICSHRTDFFFFFFNGSCFKLVAQLISSWGRWLNLRHVRKKCLLEKKCRFASKNQPPPCWLRPLVLPVLLSMDQLSE